VSLRLRALARSNDPACEAAAGDELAKGASAIDAVLAGYFAAAGAYPGVLLGPVTLLLGGTGSGDRAFDGRVRQPGKNAKRPRGVLPGEEPPHAARIGVPCSVPALAVAVGYGAHASLGRLVQAGVALARERGAERRAAVLSRVGEVGALAFSEPEVSRALVRQFGAPNGGLLTPADFARPEGLDKPALRREHAGTARLSAPWADEAAAPFARGTTVSAVDVNGLFVAAAFECQPEAIYVEELELSAPMLATPTRRGVPRATPTAPIAAPAPLWIDYDALGSAYELWTAPSSQLIDEPGARRLGIRRDGVKRTVDVVDAF
jgi:gamma-glutamyltranspeptidase/glutathione hydrolase